MKREADEEPLLDTKAAAVLFGKSPRTIRWLATQGRLPTVRLPHMRGLRFKASSLRRLIEQSEQ